jgi:hypothetical protein
MREDTAEMRRSAQRGSGAGPAERARRSGIALATVAAPTAVTSERRVSCCSMVAPPERAWAPGRILAVDIRSNPAV